MLKYLGLVVLGTITEAMRISALPVDYMKISIVKQQNSHGCKD